LRTIVSLFRIIPTSLRKRFFVLIVLWVLVGIMEMLGVASIMPFVALLSDPASIKKSTLSSMVASMLSSSDELPPLHVIGFLVLVLFVASNVLGLLSMWFSIQFSAVLGVRLSENLAVSYLRKGYLFLRSESPAVLANYVTRETEKVVSGGILQLCLLIAKLIQCVLIVCVLLFVSPAYMAIFSSIMLFFYILSFRFLRTRMARAGQISASSSARASREANEMFRAYKELLLRGSANFFIEGFRDSLYNSFTSDATARVMPVIPKYIIELAAFSGILAIPIYKSWIGEDYEEWVPVMASFAYAGYRILPSIQQAFVSLNLLKFCDPLAERFVKVLYDDPVEEGGGGKADRIRRFERAITLKGVSYTYPGQQVPAIADVNLTLFRGERLAIVGPSGAGKSTLLDIFLGLMAPTGGELLVDEKVLPGCPLPWDASVIGYVPQTPLMMHASIAQNIAFGLPEDAINRARCSAVAKFACFDGVVDRLPNGYDSVIGQDGISLSGGECQRLAIARAMYFSPEILVLDEPFSALDPVISARLVEQICSSSLEKTVVVVTHDWDSLPSFDRIAVVDEGKIVALGGFSDVSIALESLRESLISDTGEMCERRV